MLFEAFEAFKKHFEAFKKHFEAFLKYLEATLKLRLPGLVRVWALGFRVFNIIVIILHFRACTLYVVQERRDGVRS